MRIGKVRSALVMATSLEAPISKDAASIVHIDKVRSALAIATNRVDANRRGTPLELLIWKVDKKSQNFGKFQI